MVDPLFEEMGKVVPEGLLKGSWEGKDGAIYLPLPEDAFGGVIKGFVEKGLVLVGLFCEEGFREGERFTLLYVFEKRGYERLVVLLRGLGEGRASSVARDFPSASWYEREITDGFGIAFPDGPDGRPLFLHECYPDGFHPLRKSQARPREAQKRTAYAFKEVTGEGVYQIPVGPVHAGIIEPGHFRFSVIGETVLALEIRMFFKHRGIEKLAEGKTSEEGVLFAEAISGDESAANSTAFCECAERIAGTRLPARAQHLRTVLLELERMYSHLGDLAGMAVDVAYPVGASPFLVLREELLRQNRALTGSRFLKGAIVPGGLRRDLPREALAALGAYLPSFMERFVEAAKGIRSTPLVIDRYAGTGIVRRELVKPLNLSGPIARACDVRIDTRADHPYGLYAAMRLTPRLQQDGDVLARFEVKAEEVLASATIILQLLERLPDGPVRTRCASKNGYALALVEAPRGQSMHYLHLRNGTIVRYKVRTASFCNWQAIEHAVPGNIVPDFPLINKSMNLSYAGTDL